jgi:hypothetical protein
MATLAHSAGEPAAATHDRSSSTFKLSPGLCFWVAAILFYGGNAVYFAHGHFLDQTSRDLWQHLASLRELIANPYNPSNPFVITDEGSRHYHPYWVGLAFLARAVGWTEWEAMALGGFITAATLSVGIWTFGRAFYRTPWGPAALLAAMVLGWTFPVSHTGFHTPATFIEGLAYPAVLLIGLSFLLWALIIHALERPRLALLIVPLTALMFATHQLGAGIGFIAAACFILLWPYGSVRNRAVCAAALGVGLILACAWPYHGPFEAIARTGNPTWLGGRDFYGPVMLIGSFFPSFLGLFGLFHPRFSRRARPILAGLLIFGGIYAAGLTGLLISTRFVMPTTLMLHIGLGALLITTAAKWPTLSKAGQLSRFGFGFFVVFAQIACLYFYFWGESALYNKAGSSYATAQVLTRDIPDDQPIAVWDVGVWPFVATGQRVASVPWPEPMIADLAERQRDNERLFDPNLTREERLAIARRWQVKTLIIDMWGLTRRKIPRKIDRVLHQQSVRHIVGGNRFHRFDLE